MDLDNENSVEEFFFKTKKKPFDVLINNSEEIVSVIYQITPINTHGCQGETFTHEVLVRPDSSCIKIYEEFSPDGDGINDTFQISCIENYENNLQIFNRWGSLVYNVDNYENDWDGVSMGKMNVMKKEKLPPGVYYYVLQLRTETRSYSGWLYINGIK